MPCYHPIHASRTRDGYIKIGKNVADAEQLRLPCGHCIGCRMARAQEWTLRCQMEMDQHHTTAWTTLTYSDTYLPPTLDKRAIQLWLKRLRKAAARPIRYFASGEYGERTQRPHYHAILYGLGAQDDPLIQTAWARGHTRTYAATPATIAYTAGYTAKKVGWQRQPTEQVDPDTGEVYTWQPPFIQMSRRPGIGAHAKQWPESWRLYATKDGHKMPVPRYLHEAWKAQATLKDKAQLEQEIYELTKTKTRDKTEQQLHAEEAHALAKQEQQLQRRKI